MKKIVAGLVISFAIASGSIALPVLAQNQILGPNTAPADGIFEKKTPQQYVALMTAKGIDAQIVQLNNGEQTILIKNGESAFYMKPICCDTNDGECYGVQTYAFIKPNGISNDRLNQLNLNHLFVTGHVLENRLLVKRATSFIGGVSTDHFYASTAVFIADLNTMVDSVRKATTLVQNQQDEKITATAVAFSTDIAQAGRELNALDGFIGRVDGVAISARTVSTEFDMPEGLKAYLPQTD